MSAVFGIYRTICGGHLDIGLEWIYKIVWIWLSHIRFFIWMWLSGAGETKHFIAVPERVYEAFEPV